MRFRSLYIEGRTPTAGPMLDGLSSGLNVVVMGDQAAAKALRSYMWAALFGFDRPPEGADADERRDHRRLLAVTNGLLLEIANADGSPITVARYRHAQHPDADVISVTGAAAAGGADALRELLREVDARLFRDVFSLDLDEWGRIFARTASDDSKIDTAGLGAIADDAPGGAPAVSNPSEPDSDSCRNQAGENETEKPETSLHGYPDQLRALRERKAHLEMLGTSREAWNRRLEVERQMVGLPRVPYLPPDPLRRLEKILCRRSELQSALADGDRDEKKRRTELDEMAAPESLLERDEEVRQLLSDEAQYISAVGERQQIEARIRESEGQFDRELRQLGPEWKDANLESLDTSASARSALEKHEKALAEAEHAAGQAREREEAAAADAGSTGEVVAGAERELVDAGEPPAASIPELTTRRESMASLRSLVAAATEKRRELSEIHERFAGAKRAGLGASRLVVLGQLAASIVLAVVGAVVWVLGSNVGDGPVMRTGAVIVAVGLAGVVFAGTMLLLQARLRFRSSPRPREQSEDEPPDPLEWLQEAVRSTSQALRSVRDEIVSLMKVIGFEDEPQYAALEAQMSDLEDQIEQRKGFDRLGASLVSAHAEHLKAQSKAKLVSEESQRAQASRRWASEQWIDWLVKTGLPKDRSPRSVLEMLATAGEVQQQRSEIEAHRSQVAELGKAIDEIESRLKPVAQVARLPEFAPGRAGGLFAELADLRNRAKADAETVKRLDREYRSWEEERAPIEADIAEADAELQELLEQSGTHDEDQFRQLVEGSEKRRSLSEQLAALRRAAPHLLGPHSREIERDLHEMSHEQVEAEGAEIAERISFFEKRQRELETRQAGPQDAPGTTYVEAQHGQMLIDAYAFDRDRAILALSQQLIGQMFKESRPGRRPERLKSADEYLKRLTRGQYVAIRPRVGDDERDDAAVEVIDDTGQAKQVIELSRDAAAQLYLALRFALIEEHAKQVEPMPVIIDDVLVDFEPERARAACSTISELARQFQVIFLTCEPQTVDRFRESAVEDRRPDPTVIKLGDRVRQPVFN